MKQISYIILFIALFGCNGQIKTSPSNIKADSNALTGYNFDQPDKVFSMPRQLKEISGIDKMDDDRLACIEDEHGMIYIYDLKKETITKEIKFSNKGDFEDIAVNGDTAYVLRSDGSIFRVDNYNNSPVTSVINTSLNGKADTEGLYFDKPNYRLLIACKGRVNSNEIPKHTKPVYAFNLSTNKLDEKPFLMIDQKEIEEKLNKRNDFSPSAIAIHPVSGDVYVLATTGKLMITFSPAGTIKNIQTLKDKYFIQPEGICITAKGDIYISNEGRDAQANILLFKPYPAIEK